MPPPLKIMLVAGEPSGDALGAHLMDAARALAGDRLSFVGIGGERMAAAGLQSPFPIDRLAVMGLFEILPNLRAILDALNTAEDMARAEKPDLILTIDAPGFNKRLVRRLQDLAAPKAHYVAPSVWAWRPGRAKTMAGLYDHLLALLPFEPPWFENEGLPTSFVGHPAIEAARDYRGDPKGFRASIGAPQDAVLINLLFGSRRGEVVRLGPIFVRALAQLAQQNPDIRLVTPAIPALRAEIEALLQAQSLPYVVVDQDRKLDSFHAADMALAASGTVTLETALAGLPTVVAYRLNPMTAAIGRMLIGIEYVSLVNILHDRRVIPELLQENCVSDRIAGALADLLADPAARAAQIAAGREAGEMLKPGSLWPSEKAARVVIDLATRGRGDAQ